MTKRTFNLVKQLNQNASGSIMDIPHIALLRHIEPKQMILDFEKSWGSKPTAVVLPVTCPDGLLFPVTGLSEALSQYATEISHGISDFQDIVLSFANLGMDIYLLLDPTLPFIDTAALHIVNISGDGSAQTCFGNPRALDVASAILGTGVDIVIETTKTAKGKLKGVVLDLVDLWPMGGEDKRIELTCFCPACEKYFENSKPGLLRQFRTFPNPWNLLLQVTSTGIAQCDEVRVKSTASDIVGLCRQKAFDDVFQGQSMPFLLEQAELLLDFVEVRHDLTVASVNEVFSQALDGLDSVPQRIILCEGCHYGWTSGLQLERLDIGDRDENSPYDEVWFDPSSSELILRTTPFRSYMWKRARYFLDAFFQFAAIAADPAKRVNTGIARFTVNGVKGILKKRLNQALGTSVRGYTSLASLPEIKSEATDSQRVGFVGVALTREVGEKFVEGISISHGLADMGEGDGARASIEQQLMKMLGKLPGGGGSGASSET